LQNFEKASKEEAMMKTIIVLAMHGMPPQDFPKNEMAEFFSMHARLDQAKEDERAQLERRYAELDAKMRSWPRTAENDPFYAGAQEIAQYLSQQADSEVIVGFNEFCAPDVDDAIEKAIEQGAKRVVVITPMMTRGGEHSESDIPAAIRRLQAQYPEVLIIYIWPFEALEVGKFLAAQIKKFVEDKNESN
jgi:sirohydrochlorin cobaltochelatase